TGWTPAPPPSSRSVPQRPIQPARCALLQEQNALLQEHKGVTFTFFTKKSLQSVRAALQSLLIKFPFTNRGRAHRQRPRWNTSDRAERHDKAPRNDPGGRGRPYPTLTFL